MNLSQPAKFSGLFDDIIKGIGAGVSALGAVTHLGGSGNTAAKTCIGAKEIDALFVPWNGLLTAWHQNGQNTATLITQAQQIQAYMNSAPACKGQDVYYNQAKGDIASELAELQTGINTTTSATTTVDPNTGQPITISNIPLQNTTLGVPTNYLIFGSIGLLALIVLTKK